MEHGKTAKPTSLHKDSGGSASAAMPMLASEELPHAGAAASGMLSRLRVRWLGFQQRRVSRCRVFVIPHVAVLGGFALERPAFDMRWLRPLQRLADAHPRFYFLVALCFRFRV